MKEPLKLAVITFIFLTCFLLTLFAFANWELNPGNWTYETRLTFSFLELLALAASIAIGIEANE